MEVFNHRARKVGPLVQRRIEALGIGQKMQDLPEELWHKSFRHYVKENPTCKGGPNMRLIRLDPSKPSLTVTGFVFNKFVHPFEDRYITVREAARLQGFPDEVEIKGSLTSTQQQVGNAVPVPLARAVFDEVCRLAGSLGMDSLDGLSLFCGAGGLDMGADAAGTECRIRTRLATDAWADACDTIEGYAGKRTSVVQQDIRKVDDAMRFWKDRTGCAAGPDIVYGGPPCQAFSQAGKQKALGDPKGELVFDFLRIVGQLKPKFFVMGNVSNIKSVSGGALFSSIVGRMAAMGYNVSSSVLCAADFGAPQTRRRAIFLAARKDVGILRIPLPTHGPSGNLLGLKPYVSVGEAFAGLPYIGASTADES